jgi:starch synthase
MKILYVSSEVFPYAKTGSLADVSGALPLVLKSMGHDVRVIMPEHKQIYSYGADIKAVEVEIGVPMGCQVTTGRLYEGKLKNNVPIYFLENDSFFDLPGIYGENGQDYPDNAARFTFFNRGVLEACKKLSFQPDIIHCNDWQTGLIPVFLKYLYRSDKFFTKTRTVFTIHNLGYQGNFSHLDLPLTQLPWDLITHDGVEFFGKLSFLKSGLLFSDLLTTVSESYSKEICTSEFGFNMEEVLRCRSKDLYGIMNGADYSNWSPNHNPWIKKNIPIET